jgi:hypothetical protein
MKMMLRWGGSLLFSMLILVGCAGNTETQKERDVQRLADLACEMRITALNLTENDFEGLQKFNEIMEEFAAHSQEMTQKYNITDEDEEFEQMIRDALLNTPCREVDLDDLFDFFH